MSHPIMSCRTIGAVGLVRGVLQELLHHVPTLLPVPGRPGRLGAGLGRGVALLWGGMAILLVPGWRLAPLVAILHLAVPLHHGRWRRRHASFREGIEI